MIEEVRLMRAQHEELLQIAALYKRELEMPVADLGALGTCRWKLVRLVTAHLAYEDAHLYPVLSRYGATAASTGQEMSSELGQLYGDFQAHVREWTATAISADWPGYKRSTIALIDILSDRIEREERLLYPLVLGKAA